MTPEQVVDLLTLIAARDRRTVGKVDVAVWHEDIGDLDFADARQAVTEHFREEPGTWLMAGHVRRRVKAIRADRSGPAGPGLHPVPPAADPDDVPAYLAALRVQQTQLATGREPETPALTAAEKRRDYDQNPHVQGIAAQFRAERDAAARRKAERARAESAALKVYRGAVDHLLALDDHGQAATDAARDELLGDEQAARGFPLLRDATGVTDEHRITIWAARSTGWSEDR